MLIIRLLLDPELPQREVDSFENRLHKAIEVLEENERMDLENGKPITDANYGHIFHGLAMVSADFLDAVEKVEVMLSRLKANDVSIRARSLTPLLHFACKGTNEAFVMKVWEMVKREQKDLLDSPIAYEYGQRCSGKGSLNLSKEHHFLMLDFCARICPQRLPSILLDMKKIFYIENSLYLQRENQQKKLEALFVSPENLQPQPWSSLNKIFSGIGQRPQSQVVSLDSTLLCPRCNSRPQTLGFSSEERDSLKNWLIYRIRDWGSYQALFEIDKLEKFLLQEKRKGSPFTVVIDGANVGFCGIHSFDAQNIELVRKQLVAEGEKVLIIFPISYTREGNNDKFNDDFAGRIAIIEQWKPDEVYFSPSGWDDDFFWLYVAFGSESCKVQVVTNDEMRDHTHFFPPKTFSRFKQLQVVKYMMKSSSSTEKECIFVRPNLLSVDLHEFEHGKWHLPYNCESNHNSTESQWICLDLTTNLGMCGTF